MLDSPLIALPDFPRESFKQRVSVLLGKEYRVVLRGNELDLDAHRPFGLVVFAGFSCVSYLRQTKGARVVEIPALEYQLWTEKSLAFVGRLIRDGTSDMEIRLDKRTGQVIAEDLVPF